MVYSPSCRPREFRKWGRELLFSFLFVLLASEELRNIKETGTYAPITTNRGVVGESGDLFLFTDELTIRKYNTQGEKVLEFGGRGRGPGEFMWPCSIGLDGEYLYAYDLNESRVSFFTQEGQFVRQSTAILPEISYVRVSQGWLGLDLAYRQKSEARVLIFNSDFGDAHPLLKFTPNWSHAEKLWDGKTNRIPFTPVREICHIKVSDDGKTALVIHPGLEFRGEIIDIPTRKVTNLNIKGIKPVRFDVASGEQLVREKNVDSKIKFTLDAPEYYPLVKSVLWDPRGAFILERHSAGNKLKPVAIDRNGAVISMKASVPILKRLIGSWNGKAYISSFDADLEVGVVIVCNREDAEDVLEKNPITYQKPEFVMLKK